MSRHPPLFLSLLLFLSFSVSASSLPDLSSSSSTILTVEEQDHLGESLYRELKESGQINSDPQVTYYINQLGQRLLSAAPHAPHTFTFFVIDDPQINAFAMFGGYIGIYSGLIRAAKRESELASVMAHEIAHVTQNHLLRTIEKSNKMGTPVTVAILAAILLGGDAPQLAEAAATAMIAGQRQQQLSFSRSHEQEADRLGIERLSSANFNPEAMAKFFSLIQKKSRYGAVYPEFLLTHPVTTERISEAQDRARQLSKQSPQTEDQSSIEFRAIQARLTLSHTKDIEPLIRNLSDQNDIRGRYTLALALIEQQRYKEALEIINRLLRKHPEVLSFQLTEAKIYQALKRWKRAEGIYQAILDLSPHHRLVSLALVEFYLLRKEYEKGKTVLLKQAQHAPLKPDELRLLAKIANFQGDKAEMYLNMGEALILESRHSQALEEFMRAQKYAADSFYLNNRIDARIEEIKAIIDPKGRENLN